jgi:F420-dependent oxidoreductase-like protein
MRLGLEIGAYAWDGGPRRIADTLAAVARIADDAGFALLGVGDHVWQGDHAGGPEQPHLDAFTTLGLLAAHTTRIPLGPVVAGVHFRAPALLAKAVTTLDVLSGGRAVLGIGAGWNGQEAAGMGIGFPGTAERFGMLDEAIRICLALWDGERGDELPFKGRHYQLGRALNAPQSTTRPHPPILIGGGGDKTLRLVARYGDACNLYPSPDLPARFELLREYCAQEGRDYDAIERTCILPVDTGPDGSGASALADQLAAIAGLGVQTAICIVSGPDPVGQAEVLAARVAPAVAPV